MKKFKLGDTVSVSRKYFEIVERLPFPDEPEFFTGKIERIELSIGYCDYFIVFPDFWGDGYSQHEVWIRDGDMKKFACRPEKEKK